VAKLQTGFVLDQPFPKSLSGLKDVKMIVPADVPASALGESSDLTRGLAWDRKPVIHYYHKDWRGRGRRCC